MSKDQNAIAEKKQNVQCDVRRPFLKKVYIGLVEGE